MSWRSLVVALLGGLALVAAAEGIARLCPVGLPDLADKHLAWAVGTQRVFVEKGEGLETAPALQEQGNSPERFAARKRPGTFRVFCVGDSTTAGWPYNPAGAYPRWLGAILADARPDLKVEVLNAGFHGFDARRAADVLREVAAYQPDAVVFRAGYNDAHLFRLRRTPPAPAVAWLTFHSQLYNAVRRLRGRRPGGYSLQPPAEDLPEDEARRIEAAFADAVRDAASTSRGAGATLVLCDLPDAAALHHYPGQAVTARLRAALPGLAAELGAPLALFPGLSPARFVDHIHTDAEGNRLVALGAARALERAGAAPGRWRWDRVRPAAALAAAIGMTDPEFSAHVHVRLAGMHLSKGDPAGAVDELALALRAAPNPRLVPEEIEQSANRDMLQALARAQARR